MFYKMSRYKPKRYRKVSGKEGNQNICSNAELRAPVILISLLLFFVLSILLVLTSLQSTVVHVEASNRLASVREDQTQIIVTGMSRSGTSLTTSIIAALGADWRGTGPAYIRLMQKKNPKGYFERKDLVDLNYRLLRNLGVKWNKPLSKPGKLSEVYRTDFLRVARPIINDMNKHNPWVLKDCRFSLTLPYWASLLYRPICVIVFRHPLEVKSSSITKSTAVWETYTTSALRNAQNFCAHRLLVSYRSLVSDPVGAIGELQDTLVDLFKVEGLKKLTDAEAFQIVDPSLHHERFSIDQTEGMTTSEVCLWKALLDRTALSTNFTCEQ